jgi:hypothetical protein
MPGSIQASVQTSLVAMPETGAQRPSDQSEPSKDHSPRPNALLQRADSGVTASEDAAASEMSDSQPADPRPPTKPRQSAEPALDEVAPIPSGEPLRNEPSDG